MKMKYEKPMVAVDRYALTQTIAACVVKIGNNDSNCVKTDIDANSAMRQYANAGGFAGGCVVKAYRGQDFDGLCYHTSVGSRASSGSTTFNS